MCVCVCVYVCVCVCGLVGKYLHYETRNFRYSTRRNNSITFSSYTVYNRDTYVTEILISVHSYLKISRNRFAEFVTTVLGSYPVFK